MKWNEEKILIDLRQIISQIGFYPPYKKLINMGKSDLVGAITRYGGSIKFRKLTGYARKPPSYWLSLNNIITEIRFHFSDMVENKIMPTAKMMWAVGIPPSIFSNFGIQKIADELQCKVYKRWYSRDGHVLESYAEYLLDEYLYSIGVSHVPHDLLVNYLKYRCDQKVSKFFIEIWGCKKNDTSGWSAAYNTKRSKKERLYKKLNIKLISIEFQIFFQQPEEVEKCLDNIFYKLGFDITKKFTFDIKTLSMEVNARIGTYWTYEKVFEELKKLGKIPTQIELEQMGRGDLLNAIGRYGGMINFADKLGYNLNKKPNGYWTCYRIFEAIDQIGYFPTADELMQLEKRDLLRAISRNGGFPKLRLMYFSEKQKKNTMFYLS